MNKEQVSVITLEDGIDYVVLDKISIENHDYLILYEDEHPENVSVKEFFGGTDAYLEDIDDPKEYQKVIAEFFKLHPELQKSNA